MAENIRCEGWRRTGGAFSFGPVKWSQCENNAIVMLKVSQKEVKEFPACIECWNEAIERGIEIIEARPLDGACEQGGAGEE